MRHHSGLGALLLLGIVVACAKESDGTPAPLLHEHGIRVGQQLPEFSLNCGGSSSRLVPSHDEMQLVTFLSSGDCWTCRAHVAGIIDVIVSKQLLRLPHRLVIYAPAEEYTALARTIPTGVNEACHDPAGGMWRLYGLENTPVTVLVINGAAAYISDSPLATQQDIEVFLRDVREVTELGRRNSTNRTARRTP